MPLQTAIRVVSRSAMHLLSYVLGVLAPVRLTPSERRFIDANRALWREMAPENNVAGDLLVEPMFHPVLMHANASFASIVGRSRKLRPLFTLQSHAHKRAKALLRSYPGAQFVYLHSLRTLPAWIGAWIRAVRVYRRLCEPRDILGLSHDGYLYGDVIYDALLARGYATVQAVDVWTLVTLQRYFFYEASIARIAREHDLRGYVSANNYIGLLPGTFARWLMRRHIEVLVRIGTHSLFVRKYRGADEIGWYGLRPEPPIFVALLDDRTGEARRQADRHIEQRLAQATDDPSANLAFDRNRRLYRDHAAFAADYGLDASKPLVFVMLHEFNDYPHSHFRRPLMFQDYYDWFVQTLERARRITSVNWVFKEHPGADYYPTKDLDVRKVMEDSAEPHIRFLAQDADFNAVSVRYIAHAIVTCIGTPGMEYACFGIPCLVAGESPYTGYGFTREPPDRESYLRDLDGIVALEPLNEDQVHVARLVAWYELGLVYELPYLLSPVYEYAQIVDFGKVDVWNDVATILRTVDRTALRHQMNMIAEFLAADGSVQLLNVEKYPFLRVAIGVPEQASASSDGPL